MTMPQRCVCTIQYKTFIKHRSETCETSTIFPTLHPACRFPFVTWLVQPVYGLTGVLTLLCLGWISDPSRFLTHHPSQIFCDPAVYMLVKGQRAWQQGQEGQQGYFQTHPHSFQFCWKASRPLDIKMHRILQPTAAGSAVPASLTSNCLLPTDDMLQWHCLSEEFVISHLQESSRADIALSHCKITSVKLTFVHLRPTESNWTLSILLCTMCGHVVLWLCLSVSVHCPSH